MRGNVTLTQGSVCGVSIRMCCRNLPQPYSCFCFLSRKCCKQEQLACPVFSEAVHTRVFVPFQHCGMYHEKLFFSGALALSWHLVRHYPLSFIKRWRAVWETAAETLSYFFSSENTACSALLFSVSSYLPFIRLLVFPFLPRSFVAVCIGIFGLVAVWQPNLTGYATFLDSAAIVCATK
jgi:hypothetical protein